MMVITFRITTKIHMSTNTYRDVLLADIDSMQRADGVVFLFHASSIIINKRLSAQSPSCRSQDWHQIPLPRIYIYILEICWVCDFLPIYTKTNTHFPASSPHPSSNDIITSILVWSSVSVCPFGYDSACAVFR